MSKNLNTAYGTQTEVHTTSYSGGKDGQCLQLTQMNDVTNIDNIQLDEDQVRDVMRTMQTWLNKRA